jgi:hypothetical protein
MIPATALWIARANAGVRGAAPFIVLFQIAGYARAFTTAATGVPGQYPWISEGNAGQLAMSVNDLEGGSNTTDISITITDQNRALTNDFANGVNILGANCTISVGFPGMPQSQYLPLMTMIVDHVDLANQNTCYKITLRDSSLLLQQFCFQVADDGFPTGNNHPATVDDTPMNILIEAALESGLPANNINFTAIEALNASAYFGLIFKFGVTYPPRAEDFIEQEILKPLGAYWFWNYLGQVTPYSMLPWEEPTPALSLDDSLVSLAAPPVPSRSTDYTSVVIYKLDGDSNGQNYGTIIVGEYAPAVNLYGISQSRIIQTRGVRSTNGGTRIAHLTIQNIFRRYGLKPLTMKIRCFLPAWRLELSDKVAITLKQIPNGMWAPQFRMAGPTGITGTLWEVKGKTVNFNDGSVELDLLDVSWQIQNGLWVFAPNGTGPYTTEEMSDYMFYSAPLITTVPAAPTLGSVDGGTLPPTVYYVKITYVDPGGETPPSAESSFSAFPNTLLTVASPTATGDATGYNVYVSTVPGQETLQNSRPVPLGTTWQEPTTGLTDTGDTPPIQNSTTPVYSNGDPARLVY